MQEETLRNQIPILRFLNKHKWRIILPTLFLGCYSGLTFYTANKSQSVQSYFYATSTHNAPFETLNREVANISDKLQSDESLLALIKKYDLFTKERRQGAPNEQLIEKMRMAVVVGPDSTKPSGRLDIIKPSGGVYIYALVRLREEEQGKVAAITNEIAEGFQAQPALSVIKIINSPLPTPNFPSIALMMLIVIPGMVSSLILIFIWEIPFLFYSKNTREMIFDPLRSDWRDERIEAKMNGNIGEVISLDIRYSFAFIGAMLAKSPIGEIFEFVGKVAR